ncbi:MAG: OmpA family protein [Alloprevotella sp.]|nr:OmpA family protein [Alloprevotella sp.]
MKTKVTALFLSALLILSGCSTIQNASNKAKMGTAVGTGGAAIGAIIGAIAGGGKGAAIGASIGAVVGGGAGVLIGNKMDKAKKAAELANAEAELIKNEETGLTYVKVTFPSGLLFATGKDELSVQAKSDLATFAKNLEADMDLYVYGFTDSQGWKNSTAEQSRQKNQLLSEQRASAVSNFMAQNGISYAQLKEVKGMGEDTTQPTLEANRRVEVYVMPSEQMIQNAKAQAGE